MLTSIANLRRNLQYLSRVDFPMALSIIRLRAISILSRVRYSDADPPWRRLGRAEIPDDAMHASLAMDVMRTASNLLRIVDGSAARILHEAYHDLECARMELGQLEASDQPIPGPAGILDAMASYRTLLYEAAQLTFRVQSIRSLWGHPIENGIKLIASRQSKLLRDMYASDAWSKRDARLRRERILREKKKRAMRIVSSRTRKSKKGRPSR